VKKNCGYKLLLHFFKGIVYNFFKMKKKLLKGEISTIITLGTLIFLGVSSLASVVFLRKTQTTKTRAASCAKVENVSYSGDVAAGKTFTCLASTNGASPYTMACGISKNGGWPYGMQSGSCSGKNCTFSVKMDDQIEAGAVYQLVAFDFRTECGPDKDDAKRIPLNVPGTQPQPTQVNCDQECCGRPDGFIYKRAIKASCDSNYKGGRYVIIDGVCQGGKKTEKPGCATCRTCKAGAQDISPVPDADLAVNECNSSCEQKEGGNPTPNPNSTTTQTITPNPNPRGNPTNIPPPTNPPPADITQIGGEGQPCIKEPGERYPFCNEGLVCFKGKCVKPRGGKDQPCISLYDSASKTYQYDCNRGLVCSTQYPSEIGICVEPTSAKGETSKAATKLEEYPPQAQAQTSTQAATLIVKPGVTVASMVQGNIVVASYDCANPNLPEELKNKICNYRDGDTLDFDLLLVDQNGIYNIIPKGTKITKKDNTITVKFFTSAGKLICTVSAAALAIESFLSIAIANSLSTPVVESLSSALGFSGIGGIVYCAANL
jgi:hypothetical protein